MLRTALAVGLFSSSSLAEPRLLPPEATSVRIREATARLLPDDSETPDGHLTLLPEGVFYTREGHDRLVSVTVKLQETLQSIRGRMKDYERTALVPCPVLTEVPQVGPRWTLGEVLLVGVAGVLVGAGAVVVLQSARSP
jgi:hypothetical protein